MSNDATTETGAILEYIKSQPQVIYSDHARLLVWDHDRHEIVEHVMERRFPERKTGHFIAGDTASFVRFWKDHAEESSRIFADHKAGEIRAVLDFHDVDERPDFCDFQAVLKPELSLRWKTWVAFSGKGMEKGKFAEFLEEHRQDIKHPDAATLLELINEMQAKRDVHYEEARNLTTGGVHLVYKDNVTMKARNEEMPTKLTLSLPIYERDINTEVEVTLRYRLREGSLAIFPVIHEAGRIQEAGFESLVAEIKEGANAPIFSGSFVLTHQYA